MEYVYRNCFYYRNSFQGSIYQGVKSIRRTSSAKYLLKYLLHVLPLVKVCTLYVKLECIPNVSPAVLCMIHHVRKLQQHKAKIIYPKYYKKCACFALIFLKKTPSKLAYFSSKIAEIVSISLIAQSVQKSRNTRFNWVFIVLGIDNFTYSKNLWPTKHGILLSDDKSSFTQSSAYSYLLLYWQWDSIRKMKMQLWGLWLIFQSQMFLWKKTGDLKSIPYMDLDFCL